MHRATREYLLLTHYGNVVFGLTGHHTRTAVHARSLIDRHAPRVTRVVIRLVERQRIFLLGSLPRELWIGLEFRKRRRKNDRPALHGVVHLRGGQRETVERGMQGKAGIGPRRMRCTKAISIETGAVSGTAQSVVPKTKMQHDTALGLSRIDINRAANRLPLCRSSTSCCLRDLKLFGRRRRQQHRVVPCQLRKRPRQFLKPRIVRASAIPNVRIGPEYHIQLIWISEASGAVVTCMAPGFGVRVLAAVRNRRSIHRERIAPTNPRNRSRYVEFPVVREPRCSCPAAPGGERAQEFMWRNPTEKRRDQRLQDGAVPS